MALKFNIDFANLSYQYDTESSQWWQSMAVSIIFGLMLSTLLSLAWLLVIGWWCQSQTIKFQRRYADWLATWRLRLALVSIGWRALAWGLAG